MTKGVNVITMEKNREVARLGAVDQAVTIQEHAVDILRLIHPKGKLLGDDYCVGDKRPALKVNIKTGAWCTAAGDSGTDLLELVTAHCGDDLDHALQDLSDRLRRRCSRSWSLSRAGSTR